MKEFEISQGTLYAYNGRGGDVVIPDGVLRIDGEVFARRNDVLSVSLPEGLESIGDKAFDSCLMLERVMLPSTLTRLGKNAFAFCVSLREITLPDSLTGLGKDSFYYCLDLRINAPHISPEGQPPYIRQGLARGFALALSQGRGVSALRKEEYLRYIRNQRKNLYKYAVRETALMQLLLDGHILHTSDLALVTDMAAQGDMPEITAMLLAYRSSCPAEPEKELEKQFAFAETGTLQPGDAAQSWNYEKKPDGTILIKGYKGHDTEIVVPAYIGSCPVTEIGPFAFSPLARRISDEQSDRRERIRDIKLPDSVTAVASSAFYGCEALGDENGLIIMRDTLYGYSELPDSVQIPEGVHHIADDAFRDNSAFRELKLPKSLETIGDRSFSGCHKLESFDIPDAVTELGTACFSDCRSLTEVYIPDSVKNIGADAFSGCGKLRIAARPGSTAYEYARKYGLKLKLYMVGEMYG